MKKNTLLQVIAALALPVIFYFIISGFKTESNEVNTISLNTIPAVNPPQYIQKDFPILYLMKATDIPMHYVMMKVQTGKWKTF